MKKKKIVFKDKVSKDWEDMVTAVLNGKSDASIFTKDGEVYLNLGDDNYRSIRLKKNGTWDLQ